MFEITHAVDRNLISYTFDTVHFCASNSFVLIDYETVF